MSDDNFREEWFKLVLSQLKENSRKHEEMEDILNKIHTENTKLIVQVEELKKDVASIDYILRGNGDPGIKGKVQVLETKLEDMSKKKHDKTKGDTAVKVAYISGASAGIISLIKHVVDALL